MDFSKLTTLDYCILWYLAGLLAMLVYLLFNNFVKKDEVIIRVEDLFASFMISLGGPILWLIPIGKFLIDLTENYGKVKHVVLWKNRRAKNKEILFGDNDDNNETDKTYPKL